MTSVVKHSWSSIEQLSNTHPVNPENYTVVVIGKTGAGKSSLIKLFCGSSVKTSSGTASCTTKPKVYREVNGGPRRWLDTQGTSDTKRQESDANILKQSFKELYKKGVQSCKIIWCVCGDMDKACGLLGREAEYINGLSLDDDDSVWRSCLIVKKCGKEQPDVTGVIDASLNFNSNGHLTDKNAVGYSCIDNSWKGVKGKDRDMYDILCTNNSTQIRKYGYLSGVEVKQLVIQKLDALPTFSLTFLREKCYKCGAEGDHRYLNKNCHASIIKIHTGHAKYYHPEPRESYHPGFSKTEKEEIDTEWYHPGIYSTENPNGLFFAMTLTLGLFEAAESWSCCGQRRALSRGCTQRKHFTQVRSWTCCPNPPMHPGCRSKHYCCGQEHGRGCQQQYSCCKRDSSSPPCTEICSLCKKKWGTGPGCIAENGFK